MPKRDPLPTDQAFTPDDPTVHVNGVAPVPTAPGMLPPDFDWDSHRLRQDFDQLAGTKKLLTTVPVRKPTKFEFVRTHPSEDYWYDTLLYETQDRRTLYLVHTHLWSELQLLLKPFRLVLTYTRSDVVLFWPMRLPGADGRTMGWWSSATEAALMAQTTWIKLVPNQDLGAYEIFEAEEAGGEPEWPALPRGELLQIAFKMAYIDSHDHPELRKARGAL